uniref:Uncharacterized protein n=1 Tax=Candidatus Kentrum sp. TC TaxID=2126339 RepID=A0A450YYJ9_9GAMM|nr:MAG: hypothetical protein BECKTC1821E_GA0114239_106710 [Candidatus Kentron sp. TC]
MVRNRWRTPRDIRVYTINGRAAVDSRDVARHFHMRHRDVASLASILRIPIEHKKRCYKIGPDSDSTIDGFAPKFWITNEGFRNLSPWLGRRKNHALRSAYREKMDIVDARNIGAKHLRWPLPYGGTGPRPCPPYGNRHEREKNDGNQSTR